MPVLRMSLIDAKLMASSLIPHLSRDVWRGEVLDHALVGAGEGQYAFATDRYTCGRYDLTNVATEYPTEPLLIPGVLLSAILSLGPKTLIHDITEYEVVIQAGVAHPEADTEDTWQASLRIRHIMKVADGVEPTYDVHYMRVFRANRHGEKFPPLNRLFDQWVIDPAAEVLNPAVLDAHYLSRFAGYARRAHNSYMRFTLPSRRANGSTPGILVEVGTRFKGILMPVIRPMKGIHEFGVDLPAVNAERIAAEAVASQPTDTEGESDATA